MLKDTILVKVILGWFVLAALTIISIVAFSVTMTLATAVMVMAFCLVPPGIILKLWPGAPAPTIAEVLHNDARQG